MSTHSASDIPRDTDESTPRFRTSSGTDSARQPNWFVRGMRSLFGYRKTSLTILVLATLLATVVLSIVDTSLEYSVALPSNKFETTVLDYSWSVLQEIGAHEHTYTSRNNDKVHDLLEQEIAALINNTSYIEYDNDLNYTNNIMFAVKYLNYDSVSYYESNNLLVRINGTDEKLPALLLSSHFDSVPSAYGITDDGMGVASMMGILKYYATGKIAQPKRTIIFNFNNNEEFGLYGANSFLKHPWFSQIHYFLNLEGTGAGGKAILFRGTDYGIVNHFSAVRFPFATSLYQQGFNNRLIHSETDYAVYKDKGGIRGVDLAFYKPRDLYHTAGDNIKNVNIKSLWHMLSSALDFTVHMAKDAIDLDDPSTQPVRSTDFAAYTSFMNFFFAAPISGIVVLNIVLLVVIPAFSLLLLVVIFNGRKAWNFNFVNVVKFPFSFVLSVTLLSFCFDVFAIPNNVFLANNSITSLAATLFSAFLLLNYAFLNGFNVLLKPFKGHQHDEKLIVILESSFLCWVALLWSTIKLSKNRIGDDHTGEIFIPLLFVLHAFAAILGLVGWSFKKSSKKSFSDRSDRQPLLHNDARNEYGSHDADSYAESSSLSLNSDFGKECDTHASKSFSYDWLIQFLIIAPISSYVIYNSGFLVLDGINKSIQESLAAQDMIYKFLKTFAIVWAIPFLPFIFKVNRIMVLILFVVLVHGVITIAFKDPFDQSNPLKLRFLETINLNASPPTNEITVSGRSMSLVESILNDMPSVKSDKSTISVASVGDGMSIYSWNSSLHPPLVPRLESPDQLLTIDILKNSSSTSDAPFGMLTGEIKIHAPKNRNCKVDFKVSDSLVKIMAEKEPQPSHSPVRSVTVYADAKPGNETIHKRWSTESFSKDASGNYVYKDFEGINQLQLNKLDWDKPYHLGFEWVPEVAGSSRDIGLQKVDVRKLGVSVECYWSELEYLPSDSESDPETNFSIPAYEELLHYSPNHVSWANRDRGLVSVKRYVEL